MQTSKRTEVAEPEGLNGICKAVVGEKRKEKQGWVCIVSGQKEQ